MHAEVTGHDGSLSTIGVRVARAGTVAQLGNRVVDLDGPLEFDVGHRPIFVDVATGAIGLECGKLPGDGLGIPNVTAAAANSGPVVYISWRRVPVCHRRPEPRPVTSIAGRCRDDMAGRPALGCGAVVTARTCSSQARMIDARARECHRALVASLARGIRGDMSCWLPGGDRAGMASGTIRDEPRMIHTDSGERHRALVARLARGIRGNMSCWLSGGDRAGMATGAICDEPRVIHTGSGERYRALVARLAGRVGDDVI